MDRSDPFWSHAYLYLPYSDDVEQIQPDENALVAATLEAMRRANQFVSEKQRHGLRDAHAKSHGIVKGTLRIDGGLPDYLRQGLFAQPRTYDVIIRFSTSPGDLRSDLVPTHRGMAIKIIGVSGPRAVDDGAATQDILLVNSPTYAFGTIRSYLKFQRRLEKLVAVSDSRAKVFAWAARSLATVYKTARRDPPPLIKMLSVANNHILGETFYTMAALRYGAYIAKLSAAPLSPSVRALAGVAVSRNDDPSILRRLVVDFFRGHCATYELGAQLCTDLHTMPVEDASVLWPEAVSPYQPIGTLEIPAQEAYSNARQIYADDVLYFTPWRALAAHRPLGSIMRVRRQAYEASSAFRHTMNKTRSSEPTDITDLPH